MTEKCLSDSEEVNVCRVVSRHNSREFREMKESLDKFSDVLTNKKISVLQTENKELHLVVDDSRDITLEDFVLAIREIIWFCEDTDTYKISLQGIERLNLPKDNIAEIAVSECGKYNIQVVHLD